MTKTLEQEEDSSMDSEEREQDASEHPRESAINDAIKDTTEMETYEPVDFSARCPLGSSN